MTNTDFIKAVEIINDMVNNGYHLFNETAEEFVKRTCKFQTIEDYERSRESFFKYINK